MAGANSLSVAVPGRRVSAAAVSAAVLVSVASTEFGVDDLHQIRRVRPIEGQTQERRNGPHQRNIPMKTNIVLQSAPAFTPAKLPAVGRFQIYRESRGVYFMPGFGSDSDAEIIEAFMFQAPAYDGGDIRVLDQSEQRMAAFVKWKVARTEIGLPVLQRANVFHDWHFAMIACDFLKQKKIRDAIEMRF
jgi:hypothetical protein